MAGSVFEILGPVMIGPSSSHTAGAVRLGRVARSILGEEPVRAEITLFGSFAKTYRGHGTDRAIVGGILGMDTDDARIRDAFTIAKNSGLAITFSFGNSDDRHPNTAGLLLVGASGKQAFIEGSSVGGGNILINKVNEFSVMVSCQYPTLLVEHEDKPGVIGRVATVLGQNGINIGHMTVARQESGSGKLMVAETDQLLPAQVLLELSQLAHVARVVVFGPI